jgi:four helix bundle protein
MNFDMWMKSVPREITDDPVWSVKVYRIALFLADVCWRDVTRLMGDGRTTGLASQLYEAVGSIGANITEGYSRGSGKDRARFYEYALGSARESTNWYFDGRHVLSEQVAFHRIRLLAEIIRLLLTMIPDQRGKYLHEDAPAYLVTEPEAWLNHVPFT